MRCNALSAHFISAELAFLSPSITSFGAKHEYAAREATVIVNLTDHSGVHKTSTLYVSFDVVTWA